MMSHGPKQLSPDQAQEFVEEIFSIYVEQWIMRRSFIDQQDDSTMSQVDARKASKSTGETIYDHMWSEHEEEVGEWIK